MVSLTHLVSQVRELWHTLRVFRRAAWKGSEYVEQENELMRMKRKSGKSWRDLERETGIPSSTIRNHIEGRVRPKPEIVDALTDAMQPSTGPWHTPVNSGTPSPVDPQGIPQAPQDIPQGVEMVPTSTLAATRELYERQLASLEAQLAEAKARIRRLTIALAVCVIFFTLLMAFDILNRDVGWFRWSLGFAASVRPAFRLAWYRL